MKYRLTNVKREDGRGWFIPDRTPLVFRYHHGRHGQLKQCDAFGVFEYPEEDIHLLILSYTRPHVLDASKVSKARGRDIAICRLAKYLDSVIKSFNEGKNLMATRLYPMKGIRVYHVFPHDDGTFAFQLRLKPKSGPEPDGRIFIPRCEKITDEMLQDAYMKISARLN